MMMIPAVCPRHGLVEVPSGISSVKGDSVIASTILPCPVKDCSESAFVRNASFSDGSLVSRSLKIYGIPESAAPEMLHLVEQVVDESISREEATEQSVDIHPKVPGFFKVWLYGEDNQTKILVAGLTTIANLLAAGAISFAVNNSNIQVNIGSGSPTQIVNSQTENTSASTTPTIPTDPPSPPGLEPVARPTVADSIAPQASLQKDTAEEPPHKARKKRKGSPQRKKRSRPKRK